MKPIAAILAAFSILGGCRRDKDVRSPQERLQYHAVQPGPESELGVETAIGEGADVNRASGSGIVPWLAASKGIDETRVYEGSAKTPEQLNLAEGSNNPAASGDTAHEVFAIAVLKVLLRSGADKDARDSLGENALHKAVLSGRVRVVDFLVSSGVRLDVQDLAGYTPLMRAIGMNHIPLTKLLISHGASTSPMSKFGQDALQLAKESGNSGILELIAAHDSIPPSP